MCPPGNNDRPQKGKIVISAAGEDDCPCKIELLWVRVGENSSAFLRIMVDVVSMARALLGIDPGKVKTMYHAAIRVTVPEGDDCVWYVIELVGAADTKKAASAVGQIREGE